MFMNSRDFRVKAWDQLKISYWSVLIVSLVVLAITGASAPFAFVLAGPMLVGQSYYYLDVAEKNNEGKNFELVIEPFKKSLITSIVANILMGIFLFLWTLLLVIPGIIKFYAYSMTNFIIAENPEIDFMEAIKKSEEMMKGNKFRLFKLHFSFIGWFILGVLTFGVGLIFVYPYVQLAITHFYLELRGNKPLVIDADY